MTPEEREHIRYEVLWEVEVSTEDWDDVLTLTTTSVSRGGLFITTSRPPDVGATIDVGLTLPDQNKVKLLGEVVRTVFTKADVNSAQTFAKKLLPAGYKVTGTRRNTKIVKK